MLDFIVGLDTEFSELIDGSHLYMPSVCLEDVVMPEDTKKMVLDTVQNYAVFKAVQKDIDLDKKITYGTGNTRTYAPHLRNIRRIVIT